MSLHDNTPPPPAYSEAFSYKNDMDTGDDKGNGKATGDRDNAASQTEHNGVGIELQKFCPDYNHGNEEGKKHSEFSGSFEYGELAKARKKRRKKRSCYVALLVISNLATLAGISYGIYKAVNNSKSQPLFKVNKENTFVSTISEEDAEFAKLRYDVLSRQIEETPLYNAWKTSNVSRCDVCNCHDVAKVQGVYTDGIYNITIDGEPVEVYCEFWEHSHDWLVFQRRYSGEQNFSQDWNSYATGFGDINKEFWLGLETLNAITSSSGPYLLQIDLQDWNNNTYFIKFRYFMVGNSSDHYRLRFRWELDANISDTLFANYGQAFSTFDQDNDLNSEENCAKINNGGWWFKDCGYVYLNGERNKEIDNYGERMVWVEKPENKNFTVLNLKATKMMIRPLRTFFHPYVNPGK